MHTGKWICGEFSSLRFTTTPTNNVHKIARFPCLAPPALFPHFSTRKKSPLLVFFPENQQIKRRWRRTTELSGWTEINNNTQQRQRQHWWKSHTVLLSRWYTGFCFVLFAIICHLFCWTTYTFHLMSKVCKNTGYIFLNLFYYTNNN